MNAPHIFIEGVTDGQRTIFRAYHRPTGVVVEQRVVRAVPVAFPSIRKTLLARLALVIGKHK